MSRYKRHKTLIYTVYPKLKVLKKERPQVFTAIKRLKKTRDEVLLSHFGFKLKSLVEKKYGKGFDAITCPPISKERIKQGYSPAAELAKKVSVYLGIDFISFFKNGKTLYAERYRTAAKRFKEGKLFMPEIKINPKSLKILIIDDVTTTNQTLNICTKSLYYQKASLVKSIALVG